MVLRSVAVLLPVLCQGVHLLQHHVAALITTGTLFDQALTLPLLDLSTLLKLALLVPLAGLTSHLLVPDQI